MVIKYLPLPEVDDVIEDEDEEIYQSQMDWCPDMRDELWNERKVKGKWKNR